MPQTTDFPVMEDGSPNPRDEALNVDPRIALTGILRVDEIYAGRKGTGFNAATFHRDYERVYRVLLDPNLADGDEYDDTDILSDFRLPRPFGSYFSNWSNPNGDPWQDESGLADFHALAIKFDAEREFDDDWTSWIVRVGYSTQMPENGPDFRFMFGGTQSYENLSNPDSPTFTPWLVMPKVSYGSSEFSVAKQWDRDGNPYLNSAKMPFVPAPTTEVSVPVLTIVRNERAFSAETIQYWAWAVNDAPFNTPGRVYGTTATWPAGTVQILPPTAVRKHFGIDSYYEVTWRLRFQRDETIQIWNAGVLQPEPLTWQRYQLDCGYYKRKEVSTGVFAPVPIIKGAGRVSSQPYLLNGDGDELPDGSDPGFLKFNDYPERDFSELFDNDTFL